MKILLVEDNSAITLALRRGLRSDYKIDVSDSGAEAITISESLEYDALLLDLGLPDISGLDVCRAIRERNVQTPILVLTGNLDVQDKVKMLDAGADDYMTKPFSLEELKARLRVLVRRKRGMGNTSVLTIADLSLDISTRQVARAEVAIELRRKEFDLLEYLMHNANKVVTRSMIVDHVWDMNDNLWTNAIDVHIKYLRDKIDRPFTIPLIKTVHGVGYKLEHVPQS